MEFELMQAINALPFHGYLGIEVLDIAPGSATVWLPDRSEYRSYVGAVQGGAVYALAEAAASAAVAGILGDELSRSTLVVSGSSVSFPRRAAGELIATATLAEDPATILRRLMRDGATLLASLVTVRDSADTKVAEVEFEWRLSRRMDSPRALFAVA